jgi:threonine synthase
MESVLFVPASIPEGKLGQLLVFGARVFRVRGTYEEAGTLCDQACEAYGWSQLSSAVNPFLLEGEKTAGLEIADRFGEEVPDWVSVPVGDGSTIAAVWKGLLEAKRVGLVRDLPRLLGVQAEGASPIVEAFEYGREVTPRPARTLADSIAVGRPRNGAQAIAAVRESRGAMVAVSDVDLLVALRDTARLEGVFAETAAAAAVAGLAEGVERGVVPRTARALALLTGTGLKDVRPVLRVTGEPVDVEPTLEAVRESLAASA